MRFRLLSYDIIDEYEREHYVRYKYQIDKNKAILEIEVNISYRDVIHNFCYQLAKLYKVDRLRVTFKNVMYVLMNNHITEYKIF